MIQKISKYLMRKAGWKTASLEGFELEKCVICVAPHTSNWDFIVGKLFYTSIGLTASFLMKKSWFFFPLGGIWRAMGGIPVERKAHTSLTDQVADLFRQRDHFQVAITPEGTRQRVSEWKKGFYFIAWKAQVPILLAYIDYARKEIGTLGIFYPTGDAESDIAQIQARYKDIQGYHPENFA